MYIPDNQDLYKSYERQQEEARRRKDEEDACDFFEELNGQFRLSLDEIEEEMRDERRPDQKS